LRELCFGRFDFSFILLNHLSFFLLLLLCCIKVNLGLS
jgi:hypothetical protein